MICRSCSASLAADVTTCGVCGAKVEATPVTDPFLGRVLLNQYVIQRKLGEGGFGAVYEAEQPAFRRKVAVKTLHKYLVSSPNLIKRFHREGLVASQLEHPSSVKMLSLGETEDGYLWIAMEYLQGQTLSKRMKEGPLSLEEFAAIIIPVCEVLEEAHSKGIIHRDLKPDNIMLTPSQGKMLPKLLDFGIAGIVDDNEGPTKTGSISGTPPYMPPEQWKGLRFTDARSDLYALGLIAYQCLSGKHPYEAETGPDWMLKHFMATPRPLAEAMDGALLPPSMQPILMKAIEKAADDRYQSVRELREALILALREKPAATPVNVKRGASAPGLSPVVIPQQSIPNLSGAKKPLSGLIVVAALLGFSLVGAGLLFFGGSQPQSSAEAPLQVGSIAIQTAPEESATIYVDGNKLTQKTPVISPPLTLSPGKHTLSFEGKSGKRTQEFTIEIIAGQTIEKSFVVAATCSDDCVQKGGLCNEGLCVLTTSAPTASAPAVIEPPEKKALTPQEKLAASAALEKIKVSANLNKCDEVFTLLYQYKKKYGTENPDYWWYKATCAEKANPEQACNAYLGLLQMAPSGKRAEKATQFINAQDRALYPSCILP